MKKILTAAALALAVSMLLLQACSGFTASAVSLMDGIEARGVTGKDPDKAFISSAADFSAQIFKNSLSRDTNTLVCPLSVLLALSMTANGAKADTLSQMEKTLGGAINIGELNEYLYSYAKALPSEKDSKLSIANSIWFRDDEGRLQVEKDFLQKNADYYGAAAYKSAFDDATLKGINNWVSDKTDGMIDKILDKIEEDAVMYLINAVVFDAKWQKAYNKNDLYNGEFTSASGEKQRAKMMTSEESKYISDGRAAGFIKPYVGGYSFAALLPEEGVSIYEYIDGLTGEGLAKTLAGAQDAYVSARMPKFSFDYKIKMNDVLAAMGIEDAFSARKADFSGLGRSSRGNIYIGEVLHKTFIAVDELGTRAGAVTKVEMKDESAAEGYYITLDRPFVFLIIDDATGLPVFIGAVTGLGQG